MGNSGELTGHVAVDELDLVKPPGAPRLEFGQLRFGSLPLGIVFVALGFELLVMEGPLLQSIPSCLKLFVRPGLGLISSIKVLFQHVKELDPPVKLLLEPVYLGRMPLLPLHRLGLSGDKFILQFQMLKEEQLKELAASVVRGLQKQSGQG